MCSLTYYFQLIHITDWLPTLYKAAGGNFSALPRNIDGIDQWDAIINNKRSLRDTVLINIDEKEKNAAIISGRWKLTFGKFTKCNMILIYVKGKPGKVK